MLLDVDGEVTFDQQYNTELADNSSQEFQDAATEFGSAVCSFSVLQMPIYSLVLLAAFLKNYDCTL